MHLLGQPNTFLAEGGGPDGARGARGGLGGLARALRPIEGAVVLWRAFIYGGDTANAHEEKAKQEYDTIHPLDGLFEDNVIVQIKHTVRARPGRLSALAFISVFLCKYVLYGVFVWARRALNS